LISAGEAEIKALGPAATTAQIENIVTATMRRIAENLMDKAFQYGRLLRLVHDLGFIIEEVDVQNLVIDEAGVLFNDLNEAEEKAEIGRRDAVILKQLHDISTAWNSFAYLLLPQYEQLVSEKTGKTIQQLTGQDPVENFGRGYFGPGVSLEDVKEGKIYKFLSDAASKTPASLSSHPLIRLADSIIGPVPAAPLGHVLDPLPPTRFLTLERLEREFERLLSDGIQQYPFYFVWEMTDLVPKLMNHSVANVLAFLREKLAVAYLHIGHIYLVHPEHPLVKGPGGFEAQWRDRQARWDAVVGAKSNEADGFDRRLELLLPKITKDLQASIVGRGTSENPRLSLSEIEQRIMQADLSSYDIPSVKISEKRFFVYAPREMNAQSLGEIEHVIGQASAGNKTLVMVNADDAARVQTLVPAAAKDFVQVLAAEHGFYQGKHHDILNVNLIIASMQRIDWDQLFIGRVQGVSFDLPAGTGYDGRVFILPLEDLFGKIVYTLDYLRAVQRSAREVLEAA